MTGRPWQFKSIYTGLWPLWLRTLGLVGSFHVMVDYTMRLFPEVFFYLYLYFNYNLDLCYPCYWTIL